LPNTTRRFTLNIPLLVLWVVAIGVAVLGYWLLQSGNAAQADFYNTQGSDYLQFLNLQTQSTIGGFLLTAGIVGVFIALATHARNWAAVALAASSAVAADADALEFDEDDEFGTADFEARDEAEAAAPATSEPSVAEADKPETDEPADVEPEAAPATAAEPEADKPETDEPKDSPERA